MDWWITSIASIGQILWTVGVSIWILLERRSSTATVAWILALIFLPVVGILVYLVFGPRRFVRRKVRRARAIERMRPRAAAELSNPHRSVDRSSQMLMDMTRRAGGASATQKATVDVFLAGEEKFRALERAIKESQHHIHLEYYIWEPDRIGTRLRDLLTERVHQGVEVRILVDAFGSKAADEAFWKPYKRAGGQVRHFNALSLTRWSPRLANFRTHRKVVVCDGTVGFTGGMNIAEVHSAEFVGDAAWRDTHVRIEGAAATGLQQVFLEDWCYATDEVLATETYLAASPTEPAADHLVQIVSSGPDENMNAIHKLYFSSIASAQSRVLVTSPYFVPDETVMSALTTAALKGVDVRVLVPAEGDVPFVAAAARSYFPELLRSGVKILQYGPPVLHAKTLVVDDSVAMIGTANMDNRSFRLNFEVLAALYGPKACRTLAEAFEKDSARATEVSASQLRRAPIHRRLFESTARIFTPLL